MGVPMAANLLKAGWHVTVYDVQPEKAKAFVAERGGAAASSLAEIGKTSDVVITMLPDGHIVRRVALGAREGDDCLVKGFAKGATIIDMSSSAPVGTRELGSDLQRRGIALMDAPVSGGVRGAVAGTLAIMIGGEKSLAEKYDGLLSAMGKRFYVGSLGSGHLSITHIFCAEYEADLDVGQP